MPYEYKTTSLLAALCSRIAFSCTFPMIASKSKAVDIIIMPNVLKFGDICESTKNLNSTIKKCYLIKKNYKILYPM